MFWQEVNAYGLSGANSVHFMEYQEIWTQSLMQETNLILIVKLEHGTCDKRQKCALVNMFIKHSLFSKEI